MRTCSKEFNLHVEPEPVGDCPDWSTLVWPLLGGDPAAIFAPPSEASILGAGNAFTFHVKGNLGAIPYAQGSVSDSASLTYNGTGCNCNLHLNITRAGDGSDINAGKVRVLTGLGATLATYSFFVAPLNAITPVDIGFVLPNTGGVPLVIEFLIACATTQPPPGMIPVSQPTVYDCSGAITNI